MDIYSILAEKACDSRFKDKIIYYEIESNRAYSFSDIFNLVNNYIDMFSQVDIRGKKKYIIVDNSVNSVIVFIALLKCGAIPVLINKLDLLFEGDNYQEYLQEINQKCQGKNIVQDLKYDYIIPSSVLNFNFINEEIYCIQNYIDNIENKNIDADCDFYISTSGTTTGRGKLVSVKDAELIKRSMASDKDYSILTSVPPASISGIILDIYRPIICNVENYMIRRDYITNARFDFFEYLSQYHINRALLPVDVLDKLNGDLTKLDFSSLDTLYLGGEINNQGVINKIRGRLLKLPKNVFVSIYGRTENYGNICSCRENKIRNLYVNALYSNSKELICTYDRKHIFKITLKNNRGVVEEIDMPYNENDYANYISVSENILDNVTINNTNNIIGEIMVDGKTTGDLGIYLNKQLFVLGRKSDLITIDGKEYFLPMIEQMFSNITKLKTAAIFDEEKNKIFVVIDYDLDSTSFYNFKLISIYANKCNKIIDEKKLPIEYPLFVASDFFPKSKLMHKTKKTELKNLIPKNEIFQERVRNYDKCFYNEVRNIIINKYPRDIEIKYKKGQFTFRKDEISFDELCDLEEQDLGYMYFSENDEYYHFVVDDCLLFDKYPDYNLYNGVYSKRSIQRVKRKHQELSSNGFIEEFNRIRDRHTHYTCLKIFGTIKNDNGFIVFQPYQIAGNNNHTGVDKIYGNDLPFTSFNQEDVEMIYLENAPNKYYDDDELAERINNYRLLLDHTYKIKKDTKDFYIDDSIANKNNIIYNQLLDNTILIPYNYKQRYRRIVEGSTSIDLSDNNIIFTTNIENVNEILENMPSYDKINLYNKFKITGLGFRDILNHEAQLNYLLDGIVCSVNWDCHNNILGTVVYPFCDNEFSLCTKPDMELYNVSKKITIKKIYNLVQGLRKTGKRDIVVNGNIKQIDLFRLQLVIVACAEDISDIDYLCDIIDNCHIIKWENKVLKKGVK